MDSGLIMFGRYAFPPNRLGYCGSPDHDALFGYLAEGQADSGFTELARRFEGAYPYLQLIALANDIADPFDPRVVEAYWVGNRLLYKVSESLFYDSLRERFRPRMNGRSFEWMAAGLLKGARPHHNFHVFEVYRRAGLLSDDRASVALERIDQCRISWGRVLAIEADFAVVKRNPLGLVAGKLSLEEPQTVQATLRLDGRSYASDVRVGDVVSLHWGWVCSALTSAALRELVRYTRDLLAVTNATL